MFTCAYDEFCTVNKKIYGRVSDLSQKLYELGSNNAQMIKIAKLVGSVTQLYKKRTFTPSVE